MKDLPSIYTKILTDRAKFLIKLLNKFHQKYIKNLKLISTKNITLQSMKNSDEENNKRIQNLFRNLQNDPKIIFYAISNLSKTILSKTI